MGPSPVEILIFGLIALNGYVSYRGFREPDFFERYLFRVDDVMVGKQYDRLVTSAFLHVDWRHFGFNMFALYVFSGIVYTQLGLFNFLIIYTLSLVAGNLLALFFHRQHGDYSAVGNSGAVSGIIFASIVIAPDSQLGLLFIPIKFPAWIFGFGYLLVTIYGVKSKIGNIGHEAHLGGAIAGILAAVAVQPSILRDHPGTVALFLLPFIGFMWLVLKRPEYMLVENYLYKQSQARQEGRKQQRQRHQIVSAEQELNALLEKVNQVGIEGLSPADRHRLDELSGNL